MIGRGARGAGLFLLATLALGGPAGEAAAQAPRDTLTIGLTQYPAILHPAMDTMAAKSYVLGFVRRPITAYGYDWQLACRLCAELPTRANGGAVIEPLADGKSGLAVRFRLRPGVRWGDGTPLSVEDVKLAWEIGRHPDSGVAGAEGWKRVLRITVEDPLTVILHLDRTVYNFASVGDFGLVPAHLEGSIFAADPAAYRQRTLYVREPTHPGLYNGPYRISRVTVGSDIQLEPNPAWGGAAPPFKKITVRTIENSAALESNLLAGAVDMVPGELGLGLEQVLAFEKRQGSRFRIGYTPGLFYEHIDLDLSVPALADKRVRHALLYALDRERIARDLYGGRQPAADHFMGPGDPMAPDPAPVRYGFDPAKARALLDAAGWKPGPGGVRVNAAGQKLAIPLMTTAGNRGRELLAQVLVSYWKQVGIEVPRQDQTPRVFFGETLSKRQLKGMGLYAWISAPESVPRDQLHSRDIPSPANQWAGQNFPGYTNPVMDSLIDRLEVTLDPAARKPLWRDLVSLYAEDLPVLPLFHRANAYILPLWLKGGEPTGHLEPASLWVEDWKIQ